MFPLYLFAYIVIECQKLSAGKATLSQSHYLSLYLSVSISVALTRLRALSLVIVYSHPTRGLQGQGNPTLPKNEYGEAQSCSQHRYVRIPYFFLLMRIMLFFAHGVNYFSTDCV